MVPHPTMRITMSAPDVSAEDIALVEQVLRSSSLSGGPMVDAFEAEWCARLGGAHAIAVSSGTAGLHLSLIAAGVRAGDFVITSPFSFVASANAALYERAVPIFVDIDPVTLNLDPAAVARAVHALEARRRRGAPVAASRDSRRLVRRRAARGASRRSFRCTSSVSPRRCGRSRHRRASRACRHRRRVRGGWRDA